MAAHAVGALRRHGLGPGSRVVLCGDSSVEFVAQLVALAHIDCSVVLLDPRMFSRASEAMEVSRAQRLLLPRDSRALDGWVDVPDDVVIATQDVVVAPPGEVTDWPGDGGHATIEAVTLDTLESWPWASRPDGLVQLTSGSTGRPKTVEKRPGHFLSNMRRTHERIGYRADDVLLPLLPLSHQYGLSILLVALLLDLPLVLANPERVRDGVRLGRRFGATVLDTTPQVHEVIVRDVETGRLSRGDVASIRLWCTGGGPLSPATRARAAQLLRRPLLDGYGSTELGNVAHVHPERPDRLLALSGIELRVVDARGEVLGVDSWGGLEVRTPDTAVTGWQPTGDLARIAEDETLWVAGRANAISRNGMLIYPAAVEQAMADAGFTCVCVGVERQTDHGSRDRLVLVIEDRFRRPRAEWDRRVARAVPEGLLPDRVLVRDELPRTPGSSKINRAALTEMVEVMERHPRSTRTVAQALARSEDWVAGRLAALHRVSEHLRRHRSEFLRLLESYSSREAAIIELDATLQALDGAAAEVVAQRPPQVPQAWVHMPSNVLLYSYVLYLLIPSLFVDLLEFRPSSRSRQELRRLHERLAPVHGLPIDLTDDTQADFVARRGRRPGLLIFTGRYANAEEVRGTLAPGQLMLFFGQGTNPVLVGADADVATAARESAAIRMLNSGQDCFGPDLLVVHRSVAEPFCNALREEVLQRSAAATRRCDPLVMREVVEHVSAHYDRVVHGGGVDLARLVIEPTILQWPASAAPHCSEVFAPVFNVVVVDDERQIRDLLGSDFYRQRAMCASVYGIPDDLASWCADLMTVSIGCSIVATDDPNQSFGGVGRAANFVATSDEVVVTRLLVSEAVATHWRSALPAVRRPVGAASE